MGVSLLHRPQVESFCCIPPEQERRREKDNVLSATSPDFQDSAKYTTIDTLTCVLLSRAVASPAAITTPYTTSVVSGQTVQHITQHSTVHLCYSTRIYPSCSPNPLVDNILRGRPINRDGSLASQSSSSHMTHTQKDISSFGSWVPGMFDSKQLLL